MAYVKLLIDNMESMSKYQFYEAMMSIRILDPFLGLSKMQFVVRYILLILEKPTMTTDE